MALRLDPSGLRSKIASSSTTSTSSTSSAIPTPSISRELVPKSNPESTRREMRTCVFAMLKTVRLEGGLYGRSLKLKLIELSYW